MDILSSPNMISLSSCAQGADNVLMLVTLYKYDRQGRIWYYSLDDRQQNLFSPYSLTLSWGMDLFSGVRKHYTFKTQAEKDRKIREILKQKSRHYKVLYSYFKDGKREKEGKAMPGESRSNTN